MINPERKPNMFLLGDFTGIIRKVLRFVSREKTDIYITHEDASNKV